MNEHAKKIWQSWLDGQEVEHRPYAKNHWVVSDPSKACTDELPQHDPESWRIKPKKKKMNNEIDKIGPICDDLKAMGEYRAVALIDRLIDANLELADENFKKSYLCIDLVEALEESVKALNSQIGDYRLTAAKKARAAIDKAKKEVEE